MELDGGLWRVKASCLCVDADGCRMEGMEGTKEGLSYY